MDRRVPGCVWLQSSDDLIRDASKPGMIRA
jgi:hypothetical protein